MAEIVMNRIDDRLIHGQVMTGWLQLRNANAIWIVDDKVANTPMMIDIFGMAAPAGISIHAFTVAEASERLSNLDELKRAKIILLVKEPKTFLRLMENGYTPSDVNYGAMGAKSAEVSTIEVAPNCSLTEEEIQDTEKLHQRGIPVWIQLVPFGGQKRTEWEKAREKAGLG
jgi:mannose/fructose/N-acetylgalactosamine-specific phosphotransferase system component IIB